MAGRYEKLFILLASEEETKFAGYEVAGWANSSLLQYSGVELRVEDPDEDTLHTGIHLTGGKEQVPAL